MHTSCIHVQTQRFERHGRHGIKTRVENPHPETLTPLKDARPAVMRVSAAGKDRLQVRALLRAFAFMPFVPNVLRDLFWPLVRKVKILRARCSIAALVKVCCPGTGRGAALSSSIGTREGFPEPSSGFFGLGLFSAFATRFAGGAGG